MKLVLLAVVIGLMLTGCGRKGVPSPVGPASDVSYPRSYPSE